MYKKIFINTLTLICILGWTAVSSPIKANAATVQKNYQQFNDKKDNGLHLGQLKDKQNRGLHLGQQKDKQNNGLHLGQQMYFNVISQIADILDVDEHVIIDKLHDGCTLAEIAESYDITEATLLKNLEDKMEAMVDGALKAGIINETQAIEMKSKFTEHIKQLLESEFNKSDTSNTSLSAPNGLTATSKNTAQIYLNWNSVYSATSYYVYRSTSSSGTYVKIATITATNYTDSNLTDDTTYYYKVKAVNNTGSSKYSYIVEVTTIGESDNNLGIPSGLTVTAKSPTEIYLNWGLVTSASSYYVYRSTSYSGTYTRIATVTTTSYTDNNLTADTTYYYKIKAHNSTYTSNYSSIIYTTTNKYSNGDLNVPDGLTAAFMSNTEITLNWNSVTGATYYCVYRSTSYSGTYTRIATVLAPNFTDYSLEADKTYYYKVEAHNNTNTSGYSSIVSVSTN